METSAPDLEARPAVLQAVRRVPDQMWPTMLAIVQLEETPRRRHHRQSSRKGWQPGFKFPVHPLAGFHALNYSMFDLACSYAQNQMSAYV